MLQLIAMAVWVGGLVFFAFVLAPTAFQVLPTKHEAGLIVGAALHLFDYVAMGAGVVFLLATGLLFREAPKRIQGRYEIEFLLTLVMVLGTAYIHYNILPAMEADRVNVGGDVDSAALTNPARMHFDKLHARSERVEGGVLLLGFGVLFLMSRERAGRNTTDRLTAA